MSWSRGLFGALMVLMTACTPEGSGPEAPSEKELATTAQALSATAQYDSVFKAPRCAQTASSCSSGSLLTGRAAVGPEANAPNTIGGTCADGVSGRFRVDESLDALTISTLDGADLAAGKTVRVNATVWAYTGYTSDFLDIYQSTNGGSTWSLVVTLPSTKAGAQTLSTTFVLPAGGPTRAIRGQYRYGGVAGSCVSGSFNDRDDLVFAVAGSTGGVDAGGVDAGGVDAGGVDAGVVDAGVIVPLVNPGFEAGLTGWSVTGAGSATTVLGGRTGNALSLSLSGATTSTVGQSAFVPGPGTAIVRVWYRNPTITNTSGGLSINVVNLSLTGPGLTASGCGTLPSSTWTQAICQIDEFAGKNVRIDLSSQNAVLIDDVSISTVALAPDATAFAVDGGAGDAPFLANGGFEVGATGWTFVGDATAASAIGVARTGSFRASFTSGASPFASTSGGNAISQVLPASSQPVMVTAWFRTTLAATSSSLNITVVNADGSAGGCGSVSGSTTAWTKNACLLGASTQPRTLRLEGYASTVQSLLVDDVVIEPVANGAFDYGLTGWGTTGAVSTDNVTGTAVLRPSVGAPAGLAQTFTRTAAISSLGLSYKWESACQTCGASQLVMTLSAPGFATQTSYLSKVNNVGFYSSGNSLTSFPVGTKVTLSLRADSALAPNTTELFRIDNVTTY